LGLPVLENDKVLAPQTGDRPLIPCDGGIHADVRNAGLKERFFLR
jgi:hypothetical protein